MDYKAKINGHFDFEFSEGEIDGLDTVPISENKFHSIIDGRSIQTELVGSEFLWKRYSVKINSTLYEVEISTELDKLIEKMGLSLSSTQTANEIKAPMPGLILEVDVKEGDQVKEGDPLLVLEAMKMENALSAPRDGKVKCVLAKKGGTVEKGQLLVEME